MGLDVKSTGAGIRDGNLQTLFKNEMLKVYHPREREDWIWCPILGHYFPRADMKAGHLFAYMHGQDAMDAISGPTKSLELFSAHNGLFVTNAIEKYFDSGKFMIVSPFSTCTDNSHRHPNARSPV